MGLKPVAADFESNTVFRVARRRGLAIALVDVGTEPPGSGRGQKAVERLFQRAVRAEKGAGATRDRVTSALQARSRVGSRQRDRLREPRDQRSACKWNCIEWRTAGGGRDMSFLSDAFGDRWTAGQEVQAADNVGNSLLGGHHVPKGTRGKIIETHEGLLSDTVTVEFENGYTEILKPSEIERGSWF